ncbi:MAG: hypothetical protein IJK96_02875 [Bacteroidales bacterium]|nr:hypothetical protein [Bacteroidales bacterium]
MAVVPGIEGYEEEIVTEELTATHIGGTVRVFATPMMITLMERVSRVSITPYLDEGQDSVGTLVNVTHEAAVPVGKKVWCESEVIGVDRRRVTFRVVVRDENGIVGRGIHERFIVDVDRFIEKTYTK